MEFEMEFDESQCRRRKSCGSKFKGLLALVSVIIIAERCSPEVAAMPAEERASLSEDVRSMFYHAYNNYMRYAFPHDELKPLTSTYTDSLGELGNLHLEHLSKTYNGTALTLIDSLSSLAVLGNGTEFESAVIWLGQNLFFDLDVRVNVFECNIRLLGGLVSAHVLASDPSHSLMQGGYDGRLLHLAEDLGQRLLPAFDTPTGIPYGWINLKHGVRPNETTETSTSGCGSLILEMGVLSRLTSDPSYEAAALRALRKLWSMRSPLDLVGTTLDVVTGQWIEHSAGIGAGVDSFYEYLVKAYILFGGDEYWQMFQQAYVAVQQFYRHGSWYHEADMRTGRATYLQFTSLQAFWPGVQVLVGDIAAANSTHREFFSVWKKFGIFPERYLYDRDIVHPTEKYYPLRPELAESTFFLYQATKDPWYLDVGKNILQSLNVLTRVNGGFASVRDVDTMELEDHQHSFFLAETCKYLYLLFNDTFMTGRNYVFTTEGHPLPVVSAWQHWPSSLDLTPPAMGKRQKTKSDNSALNARMCPNLHRSKEQGLVESACHILDRSELHKCKKNVDCGIDAVTCRKRTCSGAGYCSTIVI